ncbi:non-specific lipid-transfer protein 1 [Capsicum chacoense]
MKAVAVLVVVVLAVVQLAMVARGAVTCGQVDANLAPCVPFLTQGGEPGAACCSGVKTLNGLAKSTDERRTTCNCAKAAANRYPNLKDDAAQSLPSKCGVTLNVPISRTINCDTIS